MRNSCLLNPIMAIAENDEMLNLGAIRLVHSAQSSFDSSVKLEVYQLSDATCTALDTNFVNSSGVDIGDTVNISPSSGRTSVYAALGEGRFDINSKYTLRQLVAENYYWKTEARSLGYCPKLEILRCFIIGDIRYLTELTTLIELQIFGGADVYGDISSLKSLVELTDLRFGIYYAAKNITGDIKDIGTLIKLTRLDLVETGIFGTLESFVENLYANNRKTGGLSIYGASTSPLVTFNESSITSDLNITFNNSGATVASGGTTIGTLSNGVWSYSS